jgi:hypothetical protein
MKKHIDKINISYLTAFIYIFIVQVMLNSLLYILNFIMVFFFIYIFFLIFYFKNIDFLYFLLYFLLYFFLINIFNFYILIFILILIINYKKINLFYSKNLIYNYLILSIKNTNKIDSTENLDNFINNLYKNKFFNNKNYSELPEYQIISKINKKNTLYQTCHILHKKGKYYIVSFLELFALDGKETTLGYDDIARRNTIASLIEQWGLCDVQSN